MDLTCKSNYWVCLWCIPSVYCLWGPNHVSLYQCFWNKAKTHWGFQETNFRCDSISSIDLCTYTFIPQIFEFLVNVRHLSHRTEDGMLHLPCGHIFYLSRGSSQESRPRQTQSSCTHASKWHYNVLFWALKVNSIKFKYWKIFVKSKLLKISLFHTLL